MGSNSVGETDQHAIRIWEVNKERLVSMQRKISDTPRLLSKSAGHSSCCIFRVPQSYIDINCLSYQPHVVSIGPYHHGKQHLQMIQEHKWRYLDALLKRTQKKGLVLEDYLKAIQPHEMSARDCYSETIHLDKDEFVEMLVLDGCFIIEMFRKFGGLVDPDPDDPLISMSWVLPFLSRDLVRLENQIPFFILKCLFDLTQMPGEENGRSLATLALEFFNYMTQRPDEVLRKYGNHEGRHLLNFLRTSFIPKDDQQWQPRVIRRFSTHGSAASTNLIHCISKLRRAGIKLEHVKPESAKSFLVVKFKKHGVIEMPTITIDDFMSSFMLNCVAYEQCHKDCSGSMHFTTYATLLDCLINTSKDVESLCDRHIIENYFGTDADIANFINNLGKDVSFDVELCYLAGLFNDVNGYYKNSWHVQWASFKYTYFDTPWSFISALAALVLLILTLLQTFYTIMGYVLPK
ncbi:UPF0481 protein At3g47200-like [Cornus florida]|uniref:UPF0481 protein At3g47200-like n=1 Tax=Cornus florida TaxID=4283 RepID=UPI00289AFDC8|nr:UPF0481 protein At3g47200-like [Cornus florida]